MKNKHGGGPTRCETHDLIQIPSPKLRAQAALNLGVSVIQGKVPGYYPKPKYDIPASTNLGERVSCEVQKNFTASLFDFYWF